MGKFDRLKFLYTFSFVDIIGLLPSIAVTLIVLYYGIKYPIPWIWESMEHLWKILATLLIVVWLPLLGFLSFLLGCIVFRITVFSILLFKDAVLYILIVFTHLPILYSLIRPSWGASLWMVQPKCQKLTIMENMRTENAWRLLLIVEKRSESKFIETLRDLPHKQIESFLFRESFTHRQQIQKSLGIDISKDTKPYKSHGA